MKNDLTNHSAGLMLDEDFARLRKDGINATIVNAGVSGDTTAGGLSRLPSAMDRHQPTLVLIELGANDGLRGQPVAQMKTNLQKLIAITRSKGAKPVLFEMRIPSNYGPVYTEQFTTAFAAVWARLLRVAERSLATDRELLGQTQI